MGGGHHHNPEADPKRDQDIQALKDAQVCRNKLEEYSHCAWLVPCFSLLSSHVFIGTYCIQGYLWTLAH